MSRFTFKDLRRYPTFPEKLMWKYLKGRQMLGQKFRRQHPIGNFIVDFVCLKWRLVIDLDGSIHEKRKEYDAFRDHCLAREGFEVIRFTNEEFEEKPELVLGKIESILRGKILTDSLKEKRE